MAAVKKKVACFPILQEILIGIDRAANIFNVVVCDFIDEGLVYYFMVFNVEQNGE